MLSVISVWNRITRWRRELSIYCSLDLSNRERERESLVCACLRCVCVCISVDRLIWCVCCAAALPQQVSEWEAKLKMCLADKSTRVCPHLLQSFGLFIKRAHKTCSKPVQRKKKKAERIWSGLKQSIDVKFSTRVSNLSCKLHDGKMMLKFDLFTGSSQQKYHVGVHAVCFEQIWYCASTPSRNVRNGQIFWLYLRPCDRHRLIQSVDCLQPQYLKLVLTFSNK